MVDTITAWDNSANIAAINLQSLDDIFDQTEIKVSYSQQVVNKPSGLRVSVGLIFKFYSVFYLLTIRLLYPLHLFSS